MFLEESLLVIGYISISKSMQCCIEVWELPMLGAKFEHSIPNPGSFKSGIISFHNYSSNRGKEIISAWELKCYDVFIKTLIVYTLACTVLIVSKEFFRGLTNHN